MPSLLERLGSLFNRQYAGQSTASSTTQVAPDTVESSSLSAGTAVAGSSFSDAVSTSTTTSGGATELSDPIVAQVNQELASEQAQPVPTEDEQLYNETHAAWANYDFERCIVIFSRLRELHPEDDGYKEKLVASYFNRGKQYEAEGNDRRATQLYYGALAVDPNFPQAKEAAEQLLAKHGETDHASA